MSTSAAAVDFYDPRRERTARGDTRVRVLVTLTGAMQLGDNHVPQGTHEITIWSSQLAAFQAGVETEEAALAQAKAMFERKIIDALADDYKQVRGMRMPEVRVIAEENREVGDELRRLEASTGDSPQAQFRVITGRDPRPLVSLKVLEQNIPEAPVAQKLEANTELASSLAQALGAVLGPALRDGIKDAVRDAVREVNGAQGDPNKKK